MAPGTESGGGGGAAEAIGELLGEGRTLLRAQPMDREAYFRWSEGARRRLAERFGPTSPKVKEFYTARREISTSFDLDPSYYLTQIGANLRRELKVLEKLAGDAGAPAPPPAAAPPATPPRPAPAQPPRPKPAGKVLIFKGGEGGIPAAAAKVAERIQVTAVEAKDQDRKGPGAIRSALESSGAGAAILVIDRGPAKSQAGTLPPETLLELGILLGVLGPKMVIVLHDPAVSLPANADGVQAISLKPDGSWEEPLRKALQSL